MQCKDLVKGKSMLGIIPYTDAFFAIPKVVATNSGFNAYGTVVKLQEESHLSPEPIGMHLTWNRV